jgi:hypothetical protein
MTNSDSESSTPTVEPPKPDGPAPASSPRRPARRRPSAPGSRTEAQLRERVAELEARLAAVTRCLEAAENAADQARAATRHAEQTLETIRATTSWKLTAPLRTGMGRVRRMLGR